MSEPKKSLLQDMIEGMAASKNRKQSPGMSQERTERDFAADMKMVEAAEEMAKEIRRRIEKTEQNPNIAETNGTRLIKNKIFGDLEMVAALRYYIELAVQRREERDSNQRLHIQSLKEIDRLNAVIAGQDEAIREQTAKVQERDEQNNNLKWQIEVARRAAKIELEERDKEIERLRAALEQFEKIPIERSNSTAMKMRAMANAALKGAE